MQYKPSDAVRESSDGVLVNINVTTQSSGNKIGFNPWEPLLKIKVKSQPVKGRANQEVIEFFKKFFKDCEVINGRTTPKKTLLLRNCTKREVEDRLETLIEGI